MKLIDNLVIKACEISNEDIRHYLVGLIPANYLTDALAHQWAVSAVIMRERGEHFEVRKNKIFIDGEFIAEGIDIEPATMIHAAYLQYFKES